jgi:DNA polymerase-1
LLKSLFENPTIGKAAHNIKYDINVIRYWLDIRVKGFFFDTMLMHHILDENPPHDLETLADIEFGTGDYSASKRSITGQGKNLLKTYDHVPDEILWPYAALDAECVYRLCEVYYARLQEKPHLWKLYCEETELAIRTLAKAEWHGSLISTEVVTNLKKEYEEKQESLLIEMRKIVPPKPECPDFEFNPMSTQQVRDAFISLGFLTEIEDKHSPNGYNTSKEVLAKLKEQGVDLADYILQYRTNRKILSTYLETALNDLDDDGRSRYSWMLHGTTSGRLSCRFLHQIPRANDQRREAGQLNLRDMFIVPKGYKYVYFDYSQIELRVLALLANDENMLSMFANDEDIHAATAACILSCNPSEVSKFNRQLGKMFNFGLAYGSEGHQLVKAGEWEDDEGTRYPVTWDMVKLGKARFKQLFPALVDYLETTPDLARMNAGVLITPLGRERRLGSKLNDRQEGIRKQAEREAVNFVIQSTAGAITIRTLNAVHQIIEDFIERKLLAEEDIVLINTVHDSGAWEVREDLVEWFNGVLKETAEKEVAQLQNYSFPCDMGVGDNWTEAEAA